MLSSTEMSPTAFYDAFLSLLPACGFVAVPGKGSDVVTIVPDTRPPSLIPLLARATQCGRYGT
jgi:hypothetical protein